MKVFTINDFNAKFPDEDVALDYLLNLLYPNGVTCKKCAKVTKHYRIVARKVFGCGVCGAQTSPTAGTILHKSPTPVRSWLYAIYLMASTRCGISAKHLQREIGVTYKTAWRMFKQIRSLLQEDVNLGGAVEMDETFVGGKAKNMHQGKRKVSGRGAVGKIVVSGMVERKGKIIARVIPDNTAATLLSMIGNHILSGSIVYTDELASYNSVRKLGYQHRRVHHAAKVYVDGDAHTNTIEGFWSLVKRSIGGAHHAVSAKYLPHYLDEYTFRWNHREDAIPMFLAFLYQIPVTKAAGLPVERQLQTQSQ